MNQLKICILFVAFLTLFIHTYEVEAKSDTYIVTPDIGLNLRAEPSKDGAIVAN